METTLHVEGMMCAHCVQAITKAVQALPGAAGVQVDLAAKTVTVSHSGALKEETLRAAIEAQGYDVA